MVLVTRTMVLVTKTTMLVTKTMALVTKTMMLVTEVLVTKTMVLVTRTMVLVTKTTRERGEGLQVGGGMEAALVHKLVSEALLQCCSSHPPSPQPIHPVTTMVQSALHWYMERDIRSFPCVTMQRRPSTVAESPSRVQ